MKKLTFALAVLMALTTSACCKKSEPKPSSPTGGGGTITPTPNPTPAPTPSIEPGTIVLTMPDASAGADEYTFDLQMSGEDIEVKGTTKKEDKDDGKIKYTTYTAAAGSEVVISGKMTLFNITAGRVEKANLSQAPKSLTRFGMRSTQTKSIDLSGATELQHLIYRDQNTIELDLSKQNKVVNMELGREQVGNNGILRKVIMPSPSDVELLNISDENVRDIDLSNLPKLRSLRAFALKVGKIDLRNSPMLEEVYFTQQSPEVKYEYFRTKNTPNLFRVVSQNVSFDEVSIENAPKLGNGGNLSNENKAYITEKKLPYRSGYDKVEGLYFNGGGPRKSLTVTGTAITKFTDKVKPQSSTLEVLNISGNKLVEASLSGFGALKMVDLSNNELTDAAMNSLAGELPQGAGVLKAKNAMADGAAVPASAEQTIQDKGWTLEK